MTKTCVICKKEPFPGDSSRSFHQFPKNSELRQKWMEATGVKEIKKVYAVCSDHFDEDSYHQTDGYTRLRRLLSTAVPLQTKNNSVLQQITSNIVLVPHLQENKNKSCSMVIDGYSLSNSLDTSSNINNIITIFRDQDDSSSSSNEREKVNDSILKTVSIAEASPRRVHIETVISDKNCINAKRKQSEAKDHPTKKFRFMDGCQPTSVCRKDFISNEAWSRFIKLMRYKNSQLGTANKKNWRRGKRISYYKELLKKLQDKSNFRSENNNSNMDQISESSQRPIGSEK